MTCRGFVISSGVKNDTLICIYCDLNLHVRGLRPWCAHTQAWRYESCLCNTYKLVCLPKVIQEEEEEKGGAEELSDVDTTSALNSASVVQSLLYC